MTRPRNAIPPLAVALALSAIPRAGVAQPSSPTDASWLRKECGHAALAYECEGRVYLTELSTGTTVRIGNGAMPEFSPDGSKLVWLDGTSIKGRMRRGGEVRTVATGVSQKGGVHWINNDEIILMRNQEWYRRTLAGREREIPALTKLGRPGLYGDVKLCEDGVWSMVTQGREWRTSDGRNGRVPGNCSVSLSPDGRSATSLYSGHEKATLTAIRPGGLQTDVQWPWKGGFDNHRWSSNDARFITVNDESADCMVIMKVGSNAAARMGKPGKGELFGDFTVGDGRGSLWPAPGTTVTAEDDSRAWPMHRQGLAFIWENGEESNAVLAAGGQAEPCRVTSRGRAHLGRFFDMVLRGGQYVAEPTTATIAFDAWQHTKQLSIEAVVTPDNLDKPGPAAIVCLSSANGRSSIVLGQERDRLVLWLRSKGADVSASELAVLGATRPHHVVVSVSYGIAQCYLGGERVASTPVGRAAEGDWGNAVLCFGGSPGGGQPWTGRIEGAALYSRLLAQHEIQRNCTEWEARLDARRPLPRLEVDAVLVKKRPIPEPGPYPNSLVTYDYEVKQIRAGRYDKKKLLVVHWGALSREAQADIVDRTEGETYRLVLEGFDAHPELVSVRMVGNDEDFDLPLFYDVSG